MDDNKKAVLLLWVNKVWGKTIDSVSELQDGCFFLHVMSAISHWSQQDDGLDEADIQTKIQTVKTFLQDFYGTKDFNGALNFDTLFSDEINKREMELAKVAVVLLGVALVDKQGGGIVQKASMELPDHLHADVVSLLEAVVQMHNGPKFILSSRIEEALQKPSEEQGDIVLESFLQMPKYECLSQECNIVSGTSMLEAGCSASPVIRMSTPLAQCRKGSDTPLNTSFGISSPFQDLNINPVSPFVTYIQSPQLIRKAILKEKELELRQLKAQLNEQVLLKEDVQMSLRDQMEENTRKDSKISELKNLIRELQFLQDAHDELQELKPKFADLESKCDKFVSRQQKLDQYKTECRMLEKETVGQRDEIHSLHQEIQCLKSQNQEKTEMLKIKNSLEKQMELLKVQLEESSRMKTLLEDELLAAKSNVQMTEEKYKELKKLTEECNEESFQGESMGVITDIQLGELKSEADRLSQEKDDLQTEIHNLKSSLDEQNSILEEMKKQVETSHQMNESLVTQLRGKCADIESLKSEIAEKEVDNKNSLALLKGKQEDDLKAFRSENEKKILSLIEGQEISVKRLQTVTEKLSLEKDSVVQEMSDLEEKMRLLQEKHAKEIDVLKEEGLKQLLVLKTEHQQEIIKQQQQNEMQKNELITGHEQQLQNVQEISEQKLLLGKEECEIQLMKVKEEFLSEIKSQKLGFETEVIELRKLNDEAIREKNEVENKMVSLRDEMEMKLESEKVQNANGIKKLKEEYESELVSLKTNFEMEMSNVQEDSKSQITSLGDKILKLKNDHAASSSQLKKEHENMLFNLNEKMASTVQQYEKEVDDLQKKMQDTEVQKAKLEEDLIELKDEVSQLKKVENNNVVKISAIQDKNTSKLIRMQEDHKNELEILETRAQENLLKQKDEYETAISKLQQENSEIISQKISVDNELSALSDEHNDLCSQLSLLQQENLKIDSEKCAAEDTLKQLKLENSDNISKKTSLGEQIRLLQEEKSSLVSQAFEMQSNLRRVEEEKSELASNKSILENDVADLHQELSEKAKKHHELEEQLNTLQCQHSEIVCAKELADKKLSNLSLEHSEIATQIKAVEENVLKLQQENTEISFQKLTTENELEALKQNLSDISSQKISLEKELTTLNLGKTEIESQKSFIEEELTCLKQENSDVLSQKNMLEQKVMDMQHEISQIISQKADFEENLSCKERDYLKIKTENVSLQEKLLKVQEETSLSMKSMKENHGQEILQLKENKDKVDVLIKDHEGEMTRVHEEKANLLEELSLLKIKLDSSAAEVKHLEAVMNEKETLAVNLQKETLEKLELERVEHKKLVANLLSEAEQRFVQEKVQLEDYVVNRMKEKFEAKMSEADERFSVEKAQLEDSIVSKMKEESDAKVSLMKNEVNELNIKLYETTEVLNCEKEEHENMLVKLQEEANQKIALNEKELKEMLARVEKERDEKLTVEKEEKERLVAKFNEDKLAQEQLISTLQEEAAEVLNGERRLVGKLKEDIAALVVERSEMVEKLSTLQEETTKMMQLQKTEHSREMQIFQEASDAKVLEVTTQCQMEIDNVRAEMEVASSQHRNQLDEEVARVRQEAEVAYEDNLDELKKQFEMAKETELKALSDQKGELLAQKEQYEDEMKAHQTKMDEKLKNLQEENRQLRERETAMIKNVETQMATANEFCNNLRQQLEASNAKLEANSTSRERIQLYEQQLKKQKETNASLQNALQIEKDTSSKMQQRLETHMTKHEKTKALLENAQKESRVYAIENNRLKTSLDYSERKLQSYKHRLEQAGNMMLGSDAHFKRTIGEHDAEMMDDSLDGNTSVISSYSLKSTTSKGSVRSRGSANSMNGSPNETIISADSVMMRRETLAGSSDLRKKAPPPGFKATMLSCDNEPDEFEWDRLSELKRRNTLCLPHMKSSYPVETQVAKKEEGSDEQAVRLSMMPGDGPKPVKRRSPRLSMVNPDEDDKSTCPNKKGKDEALGGTTIYFPLARDGAVYQPPSSLFMKSMDKQKLVASGTARKKLTPSKLSKSPGKLATRGRSYKSPGVKGKSPAHSRKADHENKSNVAFSIGFTPKKSGGRSRTMQKRTATTSQDVSMLPAETKQRTSPRQKVRKPLATRNYRETGI